MVRIHLHDPEGNLIAEIETQEGIVPQCGWVVRIESESKIAGDYKVEFVRWVIGEGEEQLLEVRMTPTGKQDLWPDGAPESNLRVLKLHGKKPEDAPETK